MASTALFAEVAALSGDPARAAMLHALMDGRALTATELARTAGVTPQTASGHLGRLAEAGLLQVAKQGRHRYYRLAAPSVARMMESIMQVAAELAPARRSLTVGPRDAALKNARTCYDHLAGRLGVGLADGLLERGHIELTGDAGILTGSGMAFLAELGIDTGPLLTGRKGRSATRPVPPLPRLERAPAPSRGRRRRCALRALACSAAGRAGSTAPARCRSRPRASASSARGWGCGWHRAPPPSARPGSYREPPRPASF